MLRMPEGRNDSKARTHELSRTYKIKNRLGIRGEVVISTRILSLGSVKAHGAEACAILVVSILVNCCVSLYWTHSLMAEASESLVNVCGDRGCEYLSQMS